MATPGGFEVLDDPAHAPIPIPQQKSQGPTYYSGGSTQPKKDKDAMKAAAGVAEGQPIGLGGNANTNPSQRISTTEFGGTASASGPA